jgi:hypothetical protein
MDDEVRGKALLITPAKNGLVIKITESVQTISPKFKLS